MGNSFILLLKFEFFKFMRKTLFILTRNVFIFVNL